MRKNQRIRKKREAERERRIAAMRQWHAEIVEVMESASVEDALARARERPDDAFNREYQLMFHETIEEANA